MKYKKRLSSELSLKTISDKQLEFILSRKAKRFKNLFKGREDAWGLMIGNKYISKSGELTDLQYRKHLEGRESLGIYPLKEDGTCNFSCVDLDFSDDPDPKERAEKEAIRIHESLLNIGFDPMFERSKSGLIHIWQLFKEPVSALKVRAVLRNILEKLSLNVRNGQVEIFPKQDSLEPGKPGNFINLPYFGQNTVMRRVMLKTPDFTPISLSEFLKRAERSRIPKETLDIAYNKLCEEQVLSKADINKRVVDILSTYWSEGQRQDLTLYTSGFMVKEGFTLEQVQEIILEVAHRAGDTDIEERINAIKSTFEKAKKGQDIKGYEGLKEKLSSQDLQTMCSLFQSEQTEEEPKNKKYKAVFPGLVDIVEDKGKVVFLVKEDSKLILKTHVEVNGETYYPPPRDSLPFLTLPRGDEVLKHYCADTDTQLYEDLRSYHVGISELPNDMFYDLLVAWDFHTYLFDLSQYSPIIWLYAVPERGKSRTGKGCINVAYRGIHIETLREAHLFRFADNLNATLFIDVMDLWRKAEKENSVDIMLHRFEKGPKVPRVLYPERGPFKDTVFYDTYGATIVATNMPVHEIMETRSLMITMPEANKKYENDITPESALSLKERLVAFRARHLGNTLPDVVVPTSGRLSVILKPLFQVIKLIKPEKEKTLSRLTRQLQSSRKAELSESNAASIIRVIVAELGRVNNAWLPLKVITDIYNNLYAGNDKYTYRKMGQELSALGFKQQSGTKKKTNRGVSIKLDIPMIIKLSIKYGVPFSLKQVRGNKRLNRRKGHSANNNSNSKDDVSSGLTLEDMKRSLEQH